MRLNINPADDVADALLRMAVFEDRDPKVQAARLLRLTLIDAGYLQEPDDVESPRGDSRGDY